jgi:nucleotide-binding universal stress UspA family protein
LIPYRNILVGFDDSEYSKAALVEALNIVRANGGSLALVHAVFFDSEEFSVSPGHLDKRLEHGKVMCEKAAETYGGEFDSGVQYLVRQGEPHEVIPDVARERGTDLIVMGTYGRRGIRRMIMGSVTSGVILDSPCDVLVVKKPCEECTGRYRSILVPYDGSALGRKAVGRAAEIAADSGEITLTVLYVIPLYEEIGFLRTNTISERIHEEARKVVIDGEKLASEKGVTANTLVEEGASTADRVVETAEGLESDLIVMGSHGWRGVDKAIMGSTTERVISRSPVPVLVVR